MNKKIRWFIEGIFLTLLVDSFFSLPIVIGVIVHNYYFPVIITLGLLSLDFFESKAYIMELKRKIKGEVDIREIPKPKFKSRADEFLHGFQYGWLCIFIGMGFQTLYAETTHNLSTALFWVAALISFVSLINWLMNVRHKESLPGVPKS